MSIRPPWWPVLATLIACGSSETPPAGPDPQLFFEERVHPVTYRDQPFSAERPWLFRTPERLPVLAISSLAVLGDRVVAGTSSGAFELDRAGDRFVAIPVAAARGAAITDLDTAAGRLLIGAADRIIDGDRVLIEPGVRAVTAIGDVLYATADRGLVEIDGGTATVLAPGPIRDLAPFAGRIAAATEGGLILVDPSAAGGMTPIALASDDVRALAVDGSALWAATAAGLSRVEGTPPMEVEALRPGPGGLPAGDLTAIASAGGLQLLGHAIGATKLGPAIEHYHSLRWIPDQAVTAVAIQGQDLWIGTPGGLSRIERHQTTLAEKAALFEGHFDVRHWRMDGFVDDDTPIADPWSPDTGFRHTDHDNDGLWTQMQIGTWCLAYAATGDEQYYLRARKALDVMFLQIDIPALTFQAAGKKPGFITRSLVRDDEGALFDDKAPRQNWHLQEYQGRQYYWKDDTSSDEYAGHFFGYPLFYDHCAKDEAERAAIRDRIRLVMDYVIDGGYRLIDLDGEKTLHGHWNDQAVAAGGIDGCPEKYPLDVCFSSYGGGGWLNSMEILGHLLATWHLTGDEKYYREYERLYTEERYGEMIPIRDHYLTITDPAIANHSDHELAMLAYFTLARYEPNPDRREILRQSLRDFYEHEREEHNPWQVAVIASAVVEDVDLAGAIQSLKDMPSDWRTWRVDNGHRQDARRWPNDRHGNPQFSRVFPYDEIRTMKWNGNPYAVAGGGGGTSVLAPTPYLIAYWKLRYFGLIDP